MRRVVITGMGIVSSIGNNVPAVTEALRHGTSGVSFAQDYAGLGFRCQVYARPTLDVEEALTRKQRRFMGEGAAWNYIAALEALEMAGLSEDEISDPRIGIIMGSGGPCTKAIIEAADKTRDQKSTRKIGPTQVPRAMSSTNSATLAV
ncbi:MAG: beta-ketoacyl synthase N-terminal-like domain-containing protein, partial [Pseudomonadota bacterium]